MSPEELRPERPPPTRAEVRARALAVAGLAAILLVVVAAATSGGFALGDKKGEGGLVSPRLPSYAAWVLIPLLVLSVVASLVVLMQVVVGRQMTRPNRIPLWQQFATLIFVVLAVIALQQAGILDRGEDARRQIGAEESGAPASPPPTSDAVTRSSAFGVVVTVVLAFVLLAILLLMYSVLRKERGRRVEALDPETRLILEAVDAGIDDLSNVDDPRAAVIACYARLEGALGAAGLARRPSEAPLEFLERVLVERAVLATSAGRLTSLFERARFSSHDIDETMRAEAIAALGQARHQIRSPA